MIHFQRTALAAAFFGAASMAAALRADVKLPAIFGDHMVLQEGKTLPVWGAAEPNEAVTVTIGAASGKATADASGKWRVDLPALTATSTPVTVTVAGKNTITLNDVLVGDVWVCSGQSNMEYGIAHDGHDTAMLAAATNPQIRLFVVPHDLEMVPQPDIGSPKPGNDLEGHWQLCSGDTLTGKWGGFGGFSAVGYYFARDLQAATGKPLGMIQTAVGGTAAQLWTSIDALQKTPELQHYMDAYNKALPGFAAAKASYPQRLAEYQAAKAAWEAKGGKEFEDAMQKWNVDNAKAMAAHQAPPPKPVAPPGQPFAPGDPTGYRTPSVLYNGMVAPLIPFLIKGVVWYQGESNADHAAEYKTLFPTMITDWRAKWGEGDFPFIFVQLATYQPPPGQEYDFLRDAQTKTLSLPNTGMATAIDVGEPKNIHPGDKVDVGKRLALVARHVAYGENIVFDGPVYDSMKIDGSAVTIHFTQVGGGLIIGKPPGGPAAALPVADHLTGFAIAGEDQKFVPAEAKIDGENVIVSSAQVPTPVAVRYDFASAPDPLGNLYNKEGLPAFPFRTDDWADPGAAEPAK
jgi:sialate O-acetylesterase